MRVTVGKCDVLFSVLIACFIPACSASSSNSAGAGGNNGIVGGGGASGSPATSAGTTGTGGTAAAHGGTGTSGGHAGTPSGGNTAGGSAGGTIGTAGASAGGSSASQYGGGCPTTPAMDGAACATDRRVCSYGDSINGDCRDTLTCTAGHWVLQQASCMQPSPAADCPAQPPASMATCTQDQQLCDYAPATECICFSNLGWICDASTSGRGCPSPAPNAGTTCPTTNQQCNYSCGLLGAYFIAATCNADGIWTWALAPCVQTN